MAIGSGLAAQAGIASESTVGTPVAVTRFFEFDNESLDRRPNFAQGVGLMGGQLVAQAGNRVETSHDAGGDITLDIPFKGLGLFLQHMLGSHSTTAVQQGASAAWQQLHNVGSSDGKSFTLQKGIPSRDGTVNPFTLSGCKLTAWELTAAANALTKLKLTVDAMDIQPTGAGALGLQAASYTAGNTKYAFHQATVQIASAYTTVSGLLTPTTPTTVGIVRQFTLKGGQPKDTAAWQAGSTTKAEALVNDYQPITGTMDIDMDANFMSRIYTPFIGNTQKVLQVTFTGPIIASTFAYTLQFTLPAAFLESGTTPNASGPGVVTTTVPFTALSDGTNSLQVQYMTTDTTV